MKIGPDTVLASSADLLAMRVEPETRFSRNGRLWQVHLQHAGCGSQFNAAGMKRKVNADNGRQDVNGKNIRWE